MITELLSKSYLATTMLTCVVGFLVVQLLRRRRYKLPPGPRGWPILGSYLTLVSGKYEQQVLLNMWAKEHGDIYMFSVLGTRFVILNTFELVQEAFQSPNIVDKTPIPPCNRALGRPNTGLGLVTGNGSLWMEQRRFITAQLRNVKQANHNYEDLVKSESNKLVQEFLSQKGAFFDPHNDIWVTIANVVTMIVMGKTYRYDDEEFVELTKNADGVFEWMGPGSLSYHVPILAYLPSKINKMGEAAVKGMFDFLKKVVEQRRQAYDPEDEPKDLIESFLQEQALRDANKKDVGSFTDNCLLQVIWDLVLGGFDTVSASLLWYFLIMAQHPDVQERIQAELDQVVGRDRLPSLTDRPKLPLTESTMVECFRHSRLIAAHLPHHAICDTKLGGYDIPKGTHVSTHAQALSLSPSFWKNPDDFVPERFIDEKTGLFDSKLEARLASFGYGRRICPGEQLARTQLFIIFTHILHRFTIRLPEGTPICMDGRNGLLYNPKPYKISAITR